MLTANKYLSIIEQAISSLRFPATPSGLYSPIEYTLQGSGKRLRPMLVLAAADACGSAPEIAINQAIGIEIFHNFTLLHDDVMDNADMRRGRPTIHKQWNENTAILSGDAMLTYATSIIAENAGEALPRVLSMFNTTAMQIYEGQQFDMDFECQDNVSVEQYLGMIFLKTAVLLGCACSIGAIMSNARRETVDALYNYGTSLGMAFQLQDDLLDTFGNPDIFGKKIGGDILNDKKTWLLINAMEDPEIFQWLGTEPSARKIEAITDIYRRNKLDIKCGKLIDDYAGKAIAALDKADIDNDAVDFFSSLATGLSSRQR